MAALSPENRRKLLIDTRRAAVALIDDIEYVRDIMTRLESAKDTGSFPGEIRRLSGVMRRFLVDRDITKVAAPRTGRLMLTAPDNKPVINSPRMSSCLFFLSGGATIFGIKIRAHLLESGIAAGPLVGFDPETEVTVSLDGFLLQPVLYISGTWVRRGSVIKYIANIASGVHSDVARKDEEFAMEQIRNHSLLLAKDSNIRFGIDRNRLLSLDRKFVYRKDSLDFVAFELLSAAHYFVISKDVITLEEYIRNELNDSPRVWES